MSSVLRQFPRLYVSISYILQTLHFEQSNKSSLTLAVRCSVPVLGCPVCQMKATANAASGATVNKLNKKNKIKCKAALCVRRRHQQLHILAHFIQNKPLQFDCAFA
jgi:hypothetical protein